MIEDQMKNLTNNIAEELPNQVNKTQAELLRTEPQDLEKMRNIFQNEKEKDKMDKDQVQRA